MEKIILFVLSLFLYSMILIDVTTAKLTTENAVELINFKKNIAKNCRSFFPDIVEVDPESGGDLCYLIANPPCMNSEGLIQPVSKECTKVLDFLIENRHTIVP